MKRYLGAMRQFKTLGLKLPKPGVFPRLVQLIVAPR